MPYLLILPGNTPSLKNSKQIVHPGGDRSRRPVIVPSKAYQKWSKAARKELKQSPFTGKKWRYPLRVSFHFVRKDDSTADYINLAQGPLDILKEAGIIQDDDMKCVIPSGFSYEVDKQHPCVVIIIEENYESSPNPYQQTIEIALRRYRGKVGL